MYCHCLIDCHPRRLVVSRPYRPQPCQRLGKPCFVVSLQRNIRLAEERASPRHVERLREVQEQRRRQREVVVA